MPRNPTSFVVRWSALEPIAHDWRYAPLAAKTAFKRAAVELLLRELDVSLALGLDRKGQRLIPITLWTRMHRKSAMGIADPDAPPLTPAYGLSRTRSFLKGRAERDGVRVYWSAGWGKILSYHARGKGHLPVRDVIGASPAVIARVRQGIAAWWIQWQQGHRQAVVLPLRKPEPLVAVQPFPDLSRFTFGIGAGRAQVERAIAQGTFSGFRQRKAR